MTSESDQITRGLGKLTPSLWRRLMRALNWYRKNRRGIKRLLAHSKRHAELPGQPQIVIATLQARDYQSDKGADDQGGIPSSEECEFLKGGHAGTCDDTAGDICTGPCVLYDAPRTIPTTVCMYPWFAVTWEESTVNASAYSDWETLPELVKWFQTDNHVIQDPPSYATQKIPTTVLCGGLRMTSTGQPADEEDNYADDYTVNVLYNGWMNADDRMVGLPPAINLATIGAVKNSEHDRTVSTPGWNHWYSFRYASTCRHKETTPFNGILPPAMNVTEYVSADGELEDLDWLDFASIQSQPLNYSPIVVLHFFPANHRSEAFYHNWSTETTESMREISMTYPFFCLTPIYGGNGCCCVLPED